jgi:hypothetical protein
VYCGIELQSIYILSPDRLEVYFAAWEKKWHDNGGKDINNPKIPLKYVVEHGQLLYGQAPPSKAVEGKPSKAEEEQPEF